MKIIKIVERHEVEHLTREGWSLVFTFQNASEMDMKTFTEQDSHNNANGFWIPPKYKMEAGVVVRPLFQLEKDLEVESREKQLEQVVSKLREDLMTAEKAKVAALNDKATLEKAAENQKASIEHYEKTLGDERSKNYRLEGDLAKVRRELGEAKWREITGR